MKNKFNQNSRFLISGALAGLANGLFGAGGGMLLLPLLIGWIGLDKKSAFATSVAIVVPISVISAYIYFQNGSIQLATALPYLLGGTLGGIFAGKIFGRISGKWLNIIFSILMLYGGIRAVMIT